STHHYTTSTRLHTPLHHSSLSLSGQTIASVCPPACSPHTRDYRRTSLLQQHASSPAVHKTHTHGHTNTHTHTHTHTLTYQHTYTPTRTCTHRHTHTLIYSKITLPQSLTRFT